MQKKQTKNNFFFVIFAGDRVIYSTAGVMNYFFYIYYEEYKDGFHYYHWLGNLGLINTDSC